LYIEKTVENPCTLMFEFLTADSSKLAPSVSTDCNQVSFVSPFSD